jgi:hypothetical protein
MTEIEVRYQPLRLLPWTRRIQATHPDTWEELTPAQLIAAASVLKGTVSDERLIASMLGLKARVVKRLSPYQKFRIIELLGFLDSYKPYGEFILPEIAGFQRPLPRLKNETFGCFIFAETYFERYASTSDPEHLARFIACWYRDAEFREADIAERARLIARECPIKQEAIFVNYFLIREWYTKEYPLVFQPAENQKRKEKSTWLDVYDAIMGDDIVREQEYALLPISTVQRYLNKRIKTAQNER